MSSPPTAHGGSDLGRSERFHRWRRYRDRIARRLIAIGGVSVILAVVMILFYLAWVVFPLFLPATAHPVSLGARSDWQQPPTEYLGIEEQQEVGLRIDRAGAAEFFELKGLATLGRNPLLPEGASAVTGVVEAEEGHGLLAVAFDDGSVGLVKQNYTTSYEGGVKNRRIEPSLEFPYGQAPRDLGLRRPVEQLALSDNADSLVLAVTAGPTLTVQVNSKQKNFLTGETTLQSQNRRVSLGFGAGGVALSGNHRWVYVGGHDGAVHRFDLPGLEPSGEVRLGPRPITSMTMLLGGISVLAGDAGGRITQLFPVRDQENTYHLQKIREFSEQSHAIRRIQTEYRRRGFVALDDSATLGVYHSTAAHEVLDVELPDTSPAAIALSPRSNGLLSISDSGTAQLLRLHNEHPEVSLSALWSKVWYENYPEPAYVWQSSSASNDFEPKFSLTPLAFGTLKAALYAMLFAVPLALMGAAFTAYFMAPGMRGLVKPTIEIMAALPTVILGFLAGLWFAPYLEEHLAGVFAVLVVLPPGLFLFAYLWSRGGSRLAALVPEGWEPALLVPVMALLVWLAMAAANPLQAWLFNGDLRTWLSQDLGVSYDQRNALVVGVAMGFAVIPTIFSIAEDAVFGVPKSLSDGSLALGATSWQTLVRVVLPTASPGIFSGLMIGVGRAVGETMIVLMATGNTPVMDWNMFEGMRTLAANIAVEMPESEVNSSHYRILFLAALVLFLFTFVVNTVAEIVRQRLREKYSSL